MPLKSAGIGGEPRVILLLRDSLLFSEPSEDIEYQIPTAREP